MITNKLSKDLKTIRSTRKSKQVTQMKQNRSKRQKQFVQTGLDGNYWNIMAADRRRNRPSLNVNHQEEPQNESMSESDDPILYSKSTFLTCRNSDNSFFLCQTLQNVHDDKQQIRIRWWTLNNDNIVYTQINDQTQFKESYDDRIDIESVLTVVKPIILQSDKLVRLRKQDLDKTKRLLRKSIRQESNKITDVTEQTQDEKSKRAAPIRKRRRTICVQEIIDQVPEEKLSRPSKPKMFKVQSNRFLKPNPIITEYDKEPFTETNLPVPYISSGVQGKLAIRAVFLNDRELLTSLIDDVARVHSVHMKHSVPAVSSAIHYAIKMNNVELLEILLNDLKYPKSNRCPYPKLTLINLPEENSSDADEDDSVEDCEGNAALTKDTKEYIAKDFEKIALFAIRNNCSHEVYKLCSKYTKARVINSKIATCIANGHRVLAASLMSDLKKLTLYRFNKLHHQVLSFDDEEIVITRAQDIVQTAKLNFRITPIHCAAINPNSKYLKKLLTVVPDYDIMDSEKRKPIHYAAACEGPEPLDYLLSKGVKLNDLDRNKNTPLHIAVKCNRLKNIELLLSKAKDQAESSKTDDMHQYEKYGLASINRKNSDGYSPLHIAASLSHTECIPILISYGATIDLAANKSSRKMTPLILACRRKNADTVKCLIQYGARVEARDSLQRTPLIHACLCGGAHIVSYLLRTGADPNVCDSSNNSALHYAVAYGWYFCVKLLLEAGANVNVMNKSQLTCLGIGFAKGHLGICEYLLNESNIDINLKNEKNMTIIMHLLDSKISKLIAETFEYAVLRHKADCKCVDINGSNAFHYLSVNCPSESDPDIKQYYFRIGQILLDHNCDPTQRNNKARTPLMLALESKNFIMVEYLIHYAKVELTTDICGDGKNLLHYFALHSDYQQPIQILIDVPVSDALMMMSHTLDNVGRTPFSYCIKKYEEMCTAPFSSTKAKLDKREAICKMIHYFLDTLSFNPDMKISNTQDSNVENLSIFHLLYDSPSTDENSEHPLDIFLKKSNRINVFHPKTGRTPLLEAVHRKQYQVIRLLIRNPSCDINLTAAAESSEHLQTPLIIACQKKDFKIIAYLLNHPQCNILAYDNIQNQALHYYLSTSSRSNEYMEIFRLFIEKLTSIGKHTLNNRGQNNATPLHIAISSNNENIAAGNVVEHLLIQNECDVFAKDDHGNTPLHTVFLGNKTDRDPVGLCALIMQAMEYTNLDTQNNEGNTPLYLATLMGSMVCVTLLLKHGANLFIENNLGNSILGACIAQKHFHLLIMFLQQPIGFRLNQIYVDSSKTQIKNSKNTSETWMWHFASQNLNPGTQQQTLISYIMQQEYFHRPLALICDDLTRFHLSYIDIIESAILNSQFNVAYNMILTTRNRTLLEEKNRLGRNLFHALMLRQISDVEKLDNILAHLFKYNIDCNSQDMYGMYPIHYACASGCKIFIDYLQNKCSDKLNLNQTDKFGDTAYSLLFWDPNKNDIITKEFLQNIITSNQCLDCLCYYDNECSRNLLSYGHKNSNSNIEHFLKQLDAANPSTIVKTSPLINAIIHDDARLVKVLLECGANSNFPDENKLTPLMHAVRKNNIEIVQLLLNSSNEFPSSIQMNAVDALGRTCIHYLIQPFSNATYVNNIEMLNLLHAHGASFNIPDQMGQTTLQYAAANIFSKHLYDKMITLLNVESMNIGTCTISYFSVNDPHVELHDPVDYYSDAQNYIDQYVKTHGLKGKNGLYRVDPLTEMTHTGEVVIDVERNRPFDVRLTITDIDHGLISLYDYYLMQMIRHNTKQDLYLLFTRWGRIGGDTQHRLTPYKSFDECREEFYKIFFEKTGHQWEDTNYFEKLPNKYILLSLNERLSHKYTDVEVDFKALNVACEKLPSQLKSSVYRNFLKTFLHDDVIRKNIDSTKLDVDWMPVSQLNLNGLRNARNLLENLKTNIAAKETLKLELQQNLSTNDSEFKRLVDSIYQLTNEYYSIVPLKGYHAAKLPIIDSLEMVKIQEQKLNDFFELELSSKILLGAQANLDYISPLDYVYRSMNCRFEAMNQDEADSQTILRYIMGSSPKIKVEQIFRISRKDDDEQFLRRNLHNRYLLWHGTNVCNLISILTRGLLVCPLSAKSTGSRFGKGIYTADAFIKSLDYCSGLKKDGIEHYFMFLCEVALGHSQEFVSDNGAEDQDLDFNLYQSRTGHGSKIPDPRFTIIDKFGVQIPLGGLISCSNPKHTSHGYTYNEYIVFDQSQIALRYLVQFRK